MKQHFLLVLVTFLLSLSACTSDDWTEPGGSGENAIRFSAYTTALKSGNGAHTRNAETTPSSLKTLGFGIMAYQSLGDYNPAATSTEFYMQDQRVTWDGSAWTYSPTKYWPAGNSRKLSFFAYGPYGASGVSLVKDSKEPKLTVTLPAKQKETVDLVAAAVRNLGTDKSGSAVTFTFSHVAAAVKMKAKASADLTANKQVQLHVTGLKLKHSEKLASDGTYSIYTGYWVKTRYLPDTYDLGDAANGILNRDPSINAVDVSTDAAGVDLFGTNTLYLIPINGTTGSAAGDVQAEVSFKLRTRPDDSSTEWVESSKTLDVNLPAGGFRQGSLTGYTFTIGLDEIQVSAEIEDYIDILIETAADLVAFRNRVNGINGSSKENKLIVKQVADIDMATLTAGSPDIENWTPIKDFAGIYDGGGYHIANLKINGAHSGSTGLFANTLENSVLTGINLTQVAFTNGGTGNTGALAGEVGGTVSHCTASGRIDYTYAHTTLKTATGGLTGCVKATGNVALCESSVTVKPTTYRESDSQAIIYLGGFAGRNEGKIAACTSTGEIEERNNYTEGVRNGGRTGGFVGTNFGSIYSSCSKGTAQYNGDNACAGGFVGEVPQTGSLIAGCYSQGDAYLNPDFGSGVFVGSFVGGSNECGTYINCFANGTTTVKFDGDQGGFFVRHMAGEYVDGSSTYRNCFTTQSYAGQNGDPINGSRYENYPGITVNAATGKALEAVRTSYKFTMSIVATNSTKVITREWDAKDFWSDTNGADGFPQINGSIEIK